MDTKDPYYVFDTLCYIQYTYHYGFSTLDSIFDILYYLFNIPYYKIYTIYFKL
jgi:hypothetical protein